MLPKKRAGQFSRFAGGQEGGLFPGRIDPTASRPTLPRPAPLPRRAPPRPDRPVVCPGFGFGKSKCRNTGKICFVAHIELEFAPREEDDRSTVYGQEQPGVPVPWTDEKRSLVLGPKKAQDSFLVQQWKCSCAKWFQLEVAPSTAGREKIPWITLCDSLHSGSTNSGSFHNARSPAHGGRRGGADRGRTGCRRVGPPRKQPLLLPPRT